MSPLLRRALDVRLAGEHVGTLTLPGSGRLAFAYDEAVAARSPGAILLSASLPVRREPYASGACRPFFEGLLPEGATREQVARERGLSPGNAFGLLAEIGAECAGAVVVLPEGEEPAPVDGSAVRWLDDADLADLIAALPARPLGVGGDVRLSLGGVQGKLVLVREESGRFGVPLGGAPSTHIVKPAGAVWPDIVANEAFCLSVARAVGLATASARVATIGGVDCLVVERFDRCVDKTGRIERLHQEDLCQALGILPTAKYEVEGGPTIAQAIALLREVSAAPAADITALLRMVGVNFLLGNADAHGKNVALVHDRAAGTRLAPLYDLVSTAAYDVTTRMAMRIGEQDEPGAVSAAAWLALAAECGVNGSLLLRELRALAGRVAAAVAAIAEDARAEGWHRPVIDGIRATVGERAQLLEA